MAPGRTLLAIVGLMVCGWPSRVGALEHQVAPGANGRRQAQLARHQGPIALRALLVPAGCEVRCAGSSFAKVNCQGICGLRHETRRGFLPAGSFSGCSTVRVLLVCSSTETASSLLYSGDPQRWDADGRSACCAAIRRRHQSRRRSTAPWSLAQHNAQMRGAVEQADAADEAQGGTRTAS